MNGNSAGERGMADEGASGGRNKAEKEMGAGVRAGDIR